MVLHINLRYAKFVYLVGVTKPTIHSLALSAAIHLAAAEYILKQSVFGIASKLGPHTLTTRYSSLWFWFT